MGFLGSLKNRLYLFFAQVTELKMKLTTQVSSMIHSARPMVMPVANIVFCCFVFLDLKSGEGRTDNMCEHLFLPAVTLGWPSGSTR